MKSPKIKIIDKILDKGYPITNKCYPQAHKQADKAEIKHYGKHKFNKLNKIINQTIPEGELARKHTKQGIIQLSSKIPQKYRNQVKFHELIELNNMKGC